jgi:hypothetical protein
MNADFENNVTQKIVDFIKEIGIEVMPAQINRPTFLPGILVERGKLFVDDAKLMYPGDLLHEAGHIAVCPNDLRSNLNDEVALPDVNMDAIEAQAIAWSYAACLCLGLDPTVVFHAGGYKGRSEGLLLNFRLGVYLGLNGLQEAGMTATELTAGESGTHVYPHMLKWLRD